MQHCNIHVATWPQALHLAFITSSFTGRVSALFFHFNLLRVLSAVGTEAAPFRTLEPCRYLSLPLRPGNQGTQIEKTWTLIPFWPACVAWRTGAARWIGGKENLGIAWGFDEYETEEAWQTNSGNQLIQLWFQVIWDCFHLWWFMMIYDDLWWFMMIYDDLWWFMMIYDDLWWFMMIYDFRVQFWIFVWYPVASFSGTIWDNCSRARTLMTATYPRRMTRCGPFKALPQKSIEIYRNPHHSCCSHRSENMWKCQLPLASSCRTSSFIAFAEAHRPKTVRNLWFILLTS